jgi:hypothetical protein
MTALHLRKLCAVPRHSICFTWHTITGFGGLPADVSNPRFLMQRDRLSLVLTKASIFLMSLYGQKCVTSLLVTRQTMCPSILNSSCQEPRTLRVKGQPQDFFVLLKRDPPCVSTRNPLSPSAKNVTLPIVLRNFINGSDAHAESHSS